MQEVYYLRLHVVYKKNQILQFRAVLLERQEGRFIESVLYTKESLATRMAE